MFNPFAKKTNTSSSKLSEPATTKPADPPFNTGFTGNGFEGGNGINKFASGGFGSVPKDNSMLSNNDARNSSNPSNNNSNFDQKFKPVNLNETGPLNFSKDKTAKSKSKSDSGSGIAE